MEDVIRIVLCDDQTLFRQGIKKLLELEEDIRIVGEASNGQEMLDMLKKTGPDIILMDIGMPLMDGVAVMYKIKKIFSNTSVIILTICEDEPHIFEAIKAGAMGYLLKNVSIEELIGAIRKVYKGEAVIQPIIATKVLKEFAMADKRKMKNGDKFYNDLTEKEKEILRLIVLGGTNKEIAGKLGISEKTVKNYLSSIFCTLHVNNRTKAVVYAIEKKL